MGSFLNACDVIERFFLFFEIVQQHFVFAINPAYKETAVEGAVHLVEFFPSFNGFGKGQKTFLRRFAKLQFLDYQVGEGDLNRAYLVAVAAQDGVRGEVPRLAVRFEAVGADKPDGGVVVGVLVGGADSLALAAVDAVEGAAQEIVLQDGGHAVVVEEYGDIHGGAGEFLSILADVFVDDLERRVQQLQVLGKEFLVLVVGTEVEDQFKVGDFVDELAYVEQDIDAGCGVEAVFAFFVVEGEGACLHDAEVGLCEQDMGDGSAVFNICDGDLADAVGVEAFGDGGQVEADLGVVLSRENLVDHFHKIFFSGGPVNLEVLGLQSSFKGDEHGLHLLDIAVAGGKGARLDIVDIEIRRDFHINGY